MITVDTHPLLSSKQLQPDLTSHRFIMRRCGDGNGRINVNLWRVVGTKFLQFLGKN